MTRPARSEGTKKTRSFAGYELVARVGTHLGAITYRAFQVALHRPVLVTLLPADEGRVPERHWRFERQVEVASRLRHENVVSAIDAGTHKGCRYFVTEHVEGRTLHGLLKSSGPLPVARAVTIARDVARALAYADSVGVVHHNLSPKSILLTHDGHTKLTGFHSAKDERQDAPPTRADGPAGDARYLAPESLGRDSALDLRADVYSLGCVLYHMLTGLAPFDADSAAVMLESHTTRPPTDPRELRADLPEPLVEVLDRCLRKRREHRYATADALARDLDAVRAGLPIGKSTSEGALWPSRTASLLPRMRRKG